MDDYLTVILEAQNEERKENDLRELAEKLREISVSADPAEMTRIPGYGRQNRLPETLNFWESAIRQTRPGVPDSWEPAAPDGEVPEQSWINEGTAEFGSGYEAALWTAAERQMGPEELSMFFQRDARRYG